MAEPVEAAIVSALLTRAKAFADAQAPAITISLPNIAFTPPAPTPTAKWLRATILPADSASLSVGFSGSNQHYGLLQIDVFYGQGGPNNSGGSELAPSRIASAIIQYFKPGTEMTKDGFTARVIRTPYRGQMMKDDPWMMIPVRIPYLCFAPNPA